MNNLTNHWTKLPEDPFLAFWQRFSHQSLMLIIRESQCSKVPNILDFASKRHKKCVYWKFNNLCSARVYFDFIGVFNGLNMHEHQNHTSEHNERVVRLSVYVIANYAERFILKEDYKWRLWRQFDYSINNRQANSISRNFSIFRWNREHLQTCGWWFESLPRKKTSRKTHFEWWSASWIEWNKLLGKPKIGSLSMKCFMYSFGWELIK